MQVEGDAEVQSKMHKTADAVEDVGQVTEQTASRTSRFMGVLKDSALGMTSAASGAVGLYFQYDNLEKAQAGRRNTARSGPQGAFSTSKATAGRRRH